MGELNGLAAVGDQLAEVYQLMQRFADEAQAVEGVDPASLNGHALLLGTEETLHIIEPSDGPHRLITAIRLPRDGEGETLVVRAVRHEGDILGKLALGKMLHLHGYSASSPGFRNGAWSGGTKPLETIQVLHGVDHG